MKKKLTFQRYLTKTTIIIVFVSLISIIAFFINGPLFFYSKKDIIKSSNINQDIAFHLEYKKQYTWFTAFGIGFGPYYSRALNLKGTKLVKTEPLEDSTINRKKIQPIDDSMGYLPQLDSIRKKQEYILSLLNQNQTLKPQLEGFDLTNFVMYAADYENVYVVLQKRHLVSVIYNRYTEQILYACKITSNYQCNYSFITTR